MKSKTSYKRRSAVTLYMRSCLKNIPFVNKHFYSSYKYLEINVALFFYSIVFGNLVLFLNMS